MPGKPYRKLWIVRERARARELIGKAKKGDERAMDMLKWMRMPFRIVRERLRSYNVIV